MLLEEPNTTGDNRGATGDNRGRPQKRTIYIQFGHFCMGSLPCPKHAIGIANCTNTTKLFKFEQFRPLWARLDMFGLVSNCFHLFGPVSSKICKLSLISNYLDLPGLFWVCLALFGRVEACLDLFGPFSACLDMFRRVWNLLDPF